VQWWRDSSDERLRQIDSRVEQHMDRFPQFLFVLSPLQVGSDLRGGWQKL
jgi:hypothetical protein